jgi:hypothetical protein
MLSHSPFYLSTTLYVFFILYIFTIFLLVVHPVLIVSFNLLFFYIRCCTY